MLGGRAGDLLGRKRMFLVGVALFSFASLLGALATTVRRCWSRPAALQGLGGAIVAPATLSIITTTFARGARAQPRARHLGRGRRRPAGRPGALVGGLLTEAAQLALDPARQRADRRRADPARRGASSWRAKGTLEHRHFDVAGAFSLTPASVALVLGIVNIERYGSGSPRCSVGARRRRRSCSLLFVADREPLGEGAARPAVDLLPRARSPARTSSCGLMGAAMFALWYFLSLYMQQVLGLTPIRRPASRSCR